METCIHHWIIEENTGLESCGVCKLCGETRIFQNWIDLHVEGRYEHGCVDQVEKDFAGVMAAR